MNLVNGVWISTHWRSKGVFFLSNKGRIENGQLHCPSKYSFKSKVYKKGDWHQTKEEALEAAESKRQAEIAKLTSLVIKIDEEEWVI